MIHLRTFLSLFLLTGAAVAAPSAEASPLAGPHPVLELRQYKLVAGHRDPFIALFEREFVETQEAEGMRLVGQFRDLDDADRFTWLRSFPSMAEREPSLTRFYFGPVWQAHRAAANPMLDDNDNVLLLRPAAPDLGFGPARGGRAAPGAPPQAAGLVTVTIYYLWKDPDEGFTEFFRTRMAPQLKAAGLPVLGAYVAEAEPNNFPRLPVRQGEKVFVWFTRTDDAAAHDAAMRRLTTAPGWAQAVAASLAGYQERQAQVLRLAPTPRSDLR